MKISVIIPTFNEERDIRNCIVSLLKSKNVNLEIIVVDDGSFDRTVACVQELESTKSHDFSVSLLTQNHKGPGAARNFGVKNANGDILVFVDADMEFSPEFIEKLTAPIACGKEIGTFSKEEYLLNKNISLARCWNLNLGRKADSMEPRDFSSQNNSLYQWGKNVLQNFEKAKVVFEENKSHVFRAILKSKFNEVGGFHTTVGYTDDWSLSEKLGVLASVAPGAKYYHRNPETLPEVWKQARWFGKNEFLTKNIVRRLYNLVRYNSFFSILNGLIGIVRFKEPNYLIFKIVYDAAIFTSVYLSFFTRDKNK